jgi:hypothetical protein
VRAATIASAVGGDLDVPGQPVLERADFLTHGARIADDAARPFEDALALRREAVEARAALDEQHAERVFELLDAGGKRGLGDAAGFGGAAEMLLAGEREEEFQLVDHASFYAAGAGAVKS